MRVLLRARAQPDALMQRAVGDDALRADAPLLASAPRRALSAMVVYAAEPGLLGLLMRTARLRGRVGRSARAPLVVLPFVLPVLTTLAFALGAVPHNYAAPSAHVHWPLSFTVAALALVFAPAAYVLATLDELQYRGRAWRRALRHPLVLLVLWMCVCGVQPTPAVDGVTRFWRYWSGLLAVGVFDPVRAARALMLVLALVFVVLLPYQWLNILCIVLYHTAMLKFAAVAGVFAVARAVSRAERDGLRDIGMHCLSARQSRHIRACVALSGVAALLIALEVVPLPLMGGVSLAPAVEAATEYVYSWFP